MSDKIRVGVVFGGKSGEHEVSIQSAKSVMAALDSAKYEVVPIGIDKQGHWAAGQQAIALLGKPEAGVWAKIAEKLSADSLAPIDVEGTAVKTESTAVRVQESGATRLPGQVIGTVDVILPVLHGSFGEDGTVQGLFELAGVPYVGAGVAASAVGMDKILMKRVFSAAGLPQVDYVECTRAQWEKSSLDVIHRIEQGVGYPCFVKPANLGSSVGISKVKSREDLTEAMSLAAQYDRRIIVEQGLEVREVEVAVLGNDHPKASVPGEVIPSNEFYDYRAKYVDGESGLEIPARLGPELTSEIRENAVKAYQAIDCSGLARVDFFIEKGTNRVLLNEINTMPGFTQYSMYPKLWEATGISYQELIDKLIELATERHEDKKRTRTDFEV